MSNFLPPPVGLASAQLTPDLAFAKLRLFQKRSSPKKFMADFKFSCPHCQQHIQADEGYAGMQINCPACHGSLTVPAPATGPATAAPPVRLTIRGSTAAPAAAEAPPPLHQPPSAGTNACPSCGNALARGAVLCTKCGYNLVTRQRTVAGRPAAPGKPQVRSGEPPWYATPWPYLGLVVVLLGVFYALGRQNPAMMLGFVAVTVLYVLTVHIMVLVAAFRESVGTGFLALCIPIYAIYFVFKISENDTLKVLYGFAVVLNIGLRFIGKFAE